MKTPADIGARQFVQVIPVNIKRQIEIGYVNGEAVAEKRVAPEPDAQCRSNNKIEAQRHGRRKAESSPSCGKIQRKIKQEDQIKKANTKYNNNVCLVKARSKAKVDKLNLQNNLNLLLDIFELKILLLLKNAIA